MLTIRYDTRCYKMLRQFQKILGHTCNAKFTTPARHDTDTTVLSCWVLCDWVKLDRAFFVGKMLGWVVKPVGWVVLGPAI